MHKPFKPLSINRDRVQQEARDAVPPRKKRRISDDDEDDVAATKAAVSIAACTTTKVSASQLHRKPLLAVNRNTLDINARHEAEATAAQPEAYYTVLWRKFSTKKNVTWDGDGVLVIRGGYAELTDISGRSMGRAACKEPLLPESEISVGGKVVQVESVLPKNEFLSGRCFLGRAVQAKAVDSAPLIDSADCLGRGHTSSAELSSKKKIRQDKLDKLQSASVGRAATLTQATKARFKAPSMALSSRESADTPKLESKPNWKHDPNAENALIMKRPTHVPKGRRVMEVVVDPILTKHLRQHQREGVSFLYECVMGMRDHQGEGAILADEMGLGKTLQTIALLWTLLRQSPIEGQDHIVRKALVVCPVSLINNWRKEFWKWLGKERIGIFVLDDNKFGKITDFTKGKSYRVMIVGYEKLRTVKDELAKADIDIVVCDEGHRLKTEKNQSARAIKELSTERRIVLTGTPMQNNFGEYHTMVDFVNPGLLGKYSVFRKQFEDPINRSRQPNAHSKDVEKGEARSEELAKLTKQFILRRTADTLAAYLPAKTEYIVFINPTEVQASVYRAAVGSSNVGAVITSPQASLQLIQMLTKICNSPRLLTRPQEEAEGLADDRVKVIAQSLSTRVAPMPGDSAKLLVLDRLLQQVRTDYPEEKVVIVSNFTSALDLIAGRLGQYGTLRLDGKTPPKDRTGLVDKFNRSSANNYFAFLLSAKAGGVGLNLIGANRLILFDCDWNPATDLQAMGRIHRDGQRRPCYIYRFLIMGAMDEKVFQRQVSKRSLADSVIDSKANSLSFTQDELRDLFTFDESGRCMTHELLGCSCAGKGLAEVDGYDASDPAEGGINHVIDDSDSDAALPDIGSFFKASVYDADEVERRVREGDTGERGGKPTGKAAKMKGLMEYQHIDPAEFVDAGGDEDNFKATNAIDSILSDDALAKCLYDGGAGKRIAYLFAKTSS